MVLRLRLVELWTYERIGKEVGISVRSVCEICRRNISQDKRAQIFTAGCQKEKLNRQRDYDIVEMKRSGNFTWRQMATITGLSISRVRQVFEKWHDQHG